MNDDEEEKLSNLASFLESLNLAVKENGNNQDIDQFITKVLKHHDQKVNINTAPALTPYPNNTASILLSRKLTLNTFLTHTNLSDKQVNLLLKLKILILKDESIYIGELKSIPPTSSAVIISIFALIAIALVITIIASPFPGSWLWPLAYGLGSLIGLIIGRVLDRSFKIYGLIERLENFTEWVPKTTS